MAEIEDRVGVAVLSVQIQQLTKDITRLEQSLEKHIASHSSNRRWVISSAMAFLTAIGGLYPLIYFALHRR